MVYSLFGDNQNKIMYQDYVITAVSLVVLSMILGGIRVRKYNFPYIYFLFGVTVASFLLTDPILVGNMFVKVLYPLFVPFLYLVGPGIYGSYLPIAERRDYWHIVHYLPILIGYTLLFLHWFLDPVHYYQSISYARQLDWINTQIFYPFTDIYIFLAYPIFSSFYYVLTIRRLVKFKSDAKQFILPTGMLFFSPLIWDTVHQFIYGKGYFIHDGAILRYILVGAIIIIFWDITMVKPPKPKEVIDRMVENKSLIAAYPNIDLLPNKTMAIYIMEFANESNIELFQKFKSKSAFIKSTSFTNEEWDQLFAFTRTSWNYLKKYIRIRRAIQIMDQGFLLNHNIDALAEEVGYNSRASLYAAFKQVMGISLPDFRLEHEV